MSLVFYAGTGMVDFCRLHPRFLPACSSMESLQAFQSLAYFWSCELSAQWCWSWCNPSAFPAHLTQLCCCCLVPLAKEEVCTLAWISQVCLRMDLLLFVINVPGMGRTAAALEGAGHRVLVMQRVSTSGTQPHDSAAAFQCTCKPCTVGCSRASV